MRSRSLRPDPTLLLIGAAALAVRVVSLLAWGRHVRLGLSDASFYTTSANLIADGEGYADLFRLFEEQGGAATAHHPPGWPALLAVFSLLGVDTELGHRLVGCLVGAVVVVLIGLLAQRVAGRRAGWIAAGIAAIHPTLVAADGSLMAETLAGLGVVTILLLALAARDRPSWGRALALGIVIGLAALVRAEALLYAGLVLVPVAVAVSRRSEPRVGLRVLVVGAIGIVVAIAPWTIRNTLLFDQVVLISINDATVLAGANCDPAYHGPDTGGWVFECAPDPGPGFDEAEKAAIWRDDGLEYAGGHLGRLPVVLGMRLARTWGVYDLHDAVEGRHAGTQFAGNIVWLAVLVPGTIAGALTLARERRRSDLVVLLAPMAAATIVTLVGFGMLRFRHPAELTAVVLTAIAADAFLNSRGMSGLESRDPPRVRNEIA